MALLVDFSQIVIGSYMTAAKYADVDMDVIRPAVLNTLRIYRNKFVSEYGELILCCDDRHTWRKDIFPNYKASRKKTRKVSGIDWNNLYDCLNQLKEELRQWFPYKLIQVEKAEADDIIAVLCRRIKEKILILSGDKDFIQLHNERIRQYNPVLNKFVGKDENPSLYIREHILRGDRSDGIPNILSDDNVFIEGRRQTPLSKKKIEAWVNEVVPTFTEEQQKNYERNRQLIDLNCVPRELEDKINREFENVKVATRDKILNYFITKKLKTLIEVIDEF